MEGIQEKTNFKTFHNYTKNSNLPYTCAMRGLHQPTKDSFDKQKAEAKQNHPVSFKSKWLTKENLIIGGTGLALAAIAIAAVISRRNPGKTLQKAQGTLSDAQRTLSNKQNVSDAQRTISGAQSALSSTEEKIQKPTEQLCTNDLINTARNNNTVITQATEETVATTQKITKKSAREIKEIINEKLDFWEVSPEAIDEQTAEILSKHLPENIRFENADIFTKSLIKEASEVADIKEKTALLKKAIELLPKGSYNEDKYSNALRKEILEKILELTKDPKSPEAQQIIKALGESKKEDYLFNKLLREAPEEFDFYVYTKIKEITPKEELSDLAFRPDKVLSFIQKRLYEIANKTTSPKDKAYFMEKALNCFEKNPYRAGLQCEWLGKYTGAWSVPELKSRVENRICEHLNTYLPEIETSKLSFSTQKEVLSQIWHFKQGAGNITASEYMPYDKIQDILNVLKLQKTLLSQEEAAVLKDTASKIAKKSGKAFENALENYYETGVFDIYKKKGYEYLDLVELSKNKMFTQEEEKIALEYIQCDDGSKTGGAYGINYLLRNTSKEELTEKLKNNKYMAEAIEGLDRLTTQAEYAVTDNCIVLRAIGPGAHVNEFKKVGNIVTDKGYVSTTPFPGTYIHMFGGRPGETYIIRIKLPKGTTGCNMRRCGYLGNGKNSEFLLPRNSQFKVLEVDDKAKIIDVEYILPEK